MATDNKSLGKFILDGIPPSPRGMPQIEVTFDIDANGILKVTALDKATGRSQNITITASSGLREDEINRMKRDAEVHAEEDRKRKELIEVRNQADNMVYTAEKSMFARLWRPNACRGQEQDRSRSCQSEAGPRQKKTWRKSAKPASRWRRSSSRLGRLSTGHRVRLPAVGTHLPPDRMGVPAGRAVGLRVDQTAKMWSMENSTRK